jgi:hypothetical protein
MGRWTVEQEPELREAIPKRDTLALELERSSKKKGKQLEFPICPQTLHDRHQLQVKLVIFLTLWDCHSFEEEFIAPARVSQEEALVYRYGLFLWEIRLQGSNEIVYSPPLSQM